MHKPLQTALMAAAFAAMTSPASAQTPQNPASISVDVGATLPRAAQATRVHLLGLLDLYNIALYAAGPAGDLQRLARRMSPKRFASRSRMRKTFAGS
jgi:hypothetical protein